MRLIHTSDWQIGKAIRLADEAAREVLRDERLKAISQASIKQWNYVASPTGCWSEGRANTTTRDTT